MTTLNDVRFTLTVDPRPSVNSRQAEQIIERAARERLVPHNIRFENWQLTFMGRISADKARDMEIAITRFAQTQSLLIYGDCYVDGEAREWIFGPPEHTRSYQGSKILKQAKLLAEELNHLHDLHRLRMLRTAVDDEIRFLEALTREERL